MSLVEEGTTAAMSAGRYARLGGEDVYAVLCTETIITFWGERNNPMLFRETAVSEP